jgi:hypothetical protein
LLALLETLALRLGEGELLDCLALPLLGLGEGLGDLVGAVGPGWRGSAPTALPAGDLEAHLLELLLARGDVLRVLAQRPLHLLDLRECVLVTAPHVQPVAHRRKCVFETGWWQPGTHANCVGFGRGHAICG